MKKKKTKKPQLKNFRKKQEKNAKKHFYQKLKERKVKYQSKKEETIISDNKKEKPKIKSKKILAYLLNGIIASILFAPLVYLFTNDIKYAGISFLAIFILIESYFFIKQLLKKSARIKKMEEVFPDFIELMASNLRAGMTIDKALLLSSRKEFAPLDEEILNLGKDIVTGKEISRALQEMANKIGSEKIIKTITIINSGIKSGGNLAILLEQTAVNMRERSFVEKKAASNVLMYMIFIFFAIAVGAPILFALSTVLLQVLMNILQGMPNVQMGGNVPNIPFALTTIKLSVTFIIYFAIIFLTAIDILASLLLGLVSTGEEKAGLKYTIPLILISLTVFFIVRFALLAYFSGI